MNYRIYTDGGSIGNPGPGGYGAVLISGKKQREISGGYRLTTNNRMELMAAIAAIGETNPGDRISLHSDSRYLVDGMNKGWAKRWKANKWRKANKKKASNTDLWKILLNLCENREVKFFWVEGHAGHPQNERCDRLAVKAAKMDDLPPDLGYETAQTMQDSLF